MRTKAFALKGEYNDTRFNLYQTAKFALVGVVMALAAGIASAQPRCSVLNATYVFTFNGTATFPGPTPVLGPLQGGGDSDLHRVGQAR